MRGSQNPARCYHYNYQRVYSSTENSVIAWRLFWLKVASKYAPLSLARVEWYVPLDRVGEDALRKTYYC